MLVTVVSERYVFKIKCRSLHSIPIEYGVEVRRNGSCMYIVALFNVSCNNFSQIFC